MAEPRDSKKNMEGGSKPPHKTTKYLRLGYTKIPQSKKPNNKKPIAKKIPGLEALERVFKPESLTQGSIRYCGDCEEGLCCGTEKVPKVIPPEALLEKSDENTCGKSSCAACGEDCEIIMQRR